MRSEHMMGMSMGCLTTLSNRILQTIQHPRRCILLSFASALALSSPPITLLDEGASDSGVVGSMNGSTIGDEGRA